jgi:hypothetical protein
MSLSYEGFVFYSQDFKWVIRIRKSKDRQHNQQKKKEKRTNNDLQKKVVYIRVRGTCYIRVIYVYIRVRGTCYIRVIYVYIRVRESTKEKGKKNKQRPTKKTPKTQKPIKINDTVMQVFFICE